MQPVIKTHVHGAAGTIILNRPEKRNALSRALLAELQLALSDMHQERRVRAVILTGAGSAFSAGMDLAEMAATSQLADPLSQWHQDAIDFLDLIRSMLDFPKPLIAAVAGPALAGGAGLALACDMVIAGESARFGLPEPRRGLVAGIVAPLLSFRVGAGRAGYLLLSTKIIGAAEAHTYGLAHEVVADDKVWARAAQIAEECATSAPEALQLTKRLLNETIGERLGSELSVGASASATARTTAAAAEGLAAFLEKREPKWK
jgi:enoyl-CoA hydratase/carnithine racemase